MPHRIIVSSRPSPSPVQDSSGRRRHRREVADVTGHLAEETDDRLVVML
jgi:hypothetical protein